MDFFNKAGMQVALFIIAVNLLVSTVLVASIQEWVPIITSNGLSSPENSIEVS